MKLDPTQSANPASDNTQRKPDGKFAKGNVGGPGNPFARKTAFLRMIALESTTEQDIREIFAMLKVKAITGDLAAAKILLSYTIGTPQPAVDPDTINKHEIETMVANTVSDPDIITKLLNVNSLDLLLPLLRFLLPEMVETNRKQALEELAKPIVPPAPPTPPPVERAPASENDPANAPQNAPGWLHEVVEHKASTPPASDTVAPAQRPSPSPSPSPQEMEMLPKAVDQLSKLAQQQPCEAKDPPIANGFGEPPPIANGFDRQPANTNAKAPPIANGVYTAPGPK